jgi:hypothetical protein
VKGFIQQVGIDQFNAIATPSSIHIAGWYSGSVKPGESGVSIIDGHVYGRYNSAIFYDLKNVKSGDNITVEYGDARRVNFSVVKVVLYSKDETSQQIFEKLPSVDRQLLLISCTGKFIKSSQTYDKRVFVYAKKV